MRRTLCPFLIWLAVAVGGLVGCTQFPELDAVATPGVATAAYPDFLPLGDLLTGEVPRASAAEIAAVEGRVGALRARADRLQRVSIAPRGVDGRVARLRRKAADLRAQ
ncbi:hypothetical protein [Antarctobacter heliothermus]|nr:hypothetical protein [Antarctobacter heliothermus]